MRVGELAKFLSLNGLIIDSGDNGIQSLNDWFVENVERKSDWKKERYWTLSNSWYSIADDIATFLGDVIIERTPEFYWSFFTPSSSNYVGYQDHVIQGITYGTGKVRPNACIAPTVTVQAVGHNAVMGESAAVSGDFVRLVNGAPAFNSPQGLAF